MSEKFYITTAIDYIDDITHIGHAYQKVIADVLARYHRLLGDNVLFLTGADEHGGKAEEAAKRAGVGFKEWADEIAEKDKNQLLSLDVSFDRYIRTTDKDHEKVVRDFWLRVKKSGDIYLGDYTGIYCDGCEGFITEKDLVDGKCPYHPSKTPRKLTERNYFFRWSKYEDFLREHIKSHPEFVQPPARRAEMLSFLDQGLSDIPISRPSVEWGIPVPDNPEHTIYVWFDALINYLTGAAEGFWPADVHLLGKDNVRWHALLWPAMLKSAGYDLPRVVYAHGFLSLEGQKISKSLGNIIRPKELAERFGSDVVRFYLCRSMSLAEDGDLSLNRLEEVYNADLANGLGNLVSRIAALCERSDLEFVDYEPKIAEILSLEQKEAVENFELNHYLELVWAKISEVDRFINDEKPWELFGDHSPQKTDSRLREILDRLVSEIREIAVLVEPFIPRAAAKIKKQFKGPRVKSTTPLFPRI